MNAPPLHRAEICIPRTLVYEGGYVNHPQDPGGPTNKGITLATFRRYIKRDGTIEDLKALTVEQAVIVYKHQYWDKACCGMMPPGVDFAVFDFGVNSGVSRGVRAVQWAVGVRQDGIAGPKTIAAVRAADAASVVNAVCDHRMAFLRRLRTWGTFGRGWTARVDNVRKLALADVK